MNFFSVSTSEANPAKAPRKKNERFSHHMFNDKSEERYTESPTETESSSRESAEMPSLQGDDQLVSAAEPTKLFSMITKRNWEGVVKRCKGEDAKEAMAWVVEKNRDNSVRWKLLPIHQACENKAPSDVVKALIAAYPDSLMLKDSAGDLPLHLACRERCSKSVIGALLSEEPSAAKVKDDEGRLPLHLACRQGTAVQVVDSLIICYFRGSRITDDYGLLPLHWACAQNASPALIASLLRANPDSIDLKDKWGRTPLSLAQASTNEDKDDVIKALKRDPSYWSANLTDEIQTLTQKLELSTTKEREAEERLRDFEEKSVMKLQKLEGESEQRYQQLEEENNKLKEEIRILTSTNKYTDEDLEKINEENYEMTKDIKTFQSKLKDYAQLVESMEAQRLSLLRVTAAMEKTINKATAIMSKNSTSSSKKGERQKKV